jgi:hypothetical protein
MPDFIFLWTVKKRNVEHFYERSQNVMVSFSVKNERLIEYSFTRRKFHNCIILFKNTKVKFKEDFFMRMCPVEKASYIQRRLMLTIGI